MILHDRVKRIANSRELTAVYDFPWRGRFA
jgi:hypothetical protein